MNRVELNARNGSTRILMGDSLSYLSEQVGRERLVIITDSDVGKLYRNRLDGYDSIEIGVGERVKTLSTVKTIYERLVEMKVDRYYFIVGMGGGLVTDIAGFSASTFMRGIRFGFIPTTLLAQVDASLGGKNGVNFQGFKNMIGTIKQPEFCLIDFSFLETLSTKQILSGMAEMIKCGAISDKGLFEYIEGNHKDMISLDKSRLEKAVESTIRVKMNFVERDELEGGERMKLNFGHTVGHAIEKVTGIPHGYAVSIGMVAAARLSKTKGLLASGQLDRLEMLLRDIGLPTKIRADYEELVEAISMDKKSAGDSINMVLLSKIGSAAILKIPKEELRETVKEVCV